MNRAVQSVTQTSAQGHPGHREDRATLVQPRDRVCSRDTLEHFSQPSRKEIRAKSFVGLPRTDGAQDAMQRWWVNRQTHTQECCKRQRDGIGPLCSQHSMGTDAVCTEMTFPLPWGTCTRNTSRTRVFLRPMSVSPFRSSMSEFRSFRIPAQSMLKAKNRRQALQAETRMVMTPCPPREKPPPSIQSSEDLLWEPILTQR